MFVEDTFFPFNKNCYRSKESRIESRSIMKRPDRRGQIKATHRSNREARWKAYICTRANKNKKETHHRESNEVPN